MTNTTRIFKLKKAKLVFKSSLLLLSLLVTNFLYSQGTVEPPPIGGPTGVGQWSGVIKLPLIPVAMANLPNGKILCWSAYKHNMFAFNNTNEEGKKTQTCIFDPSDNKYTEKEVKETGQDMFCPGINNLPDGRILVAGGNHGTLSSIYDWEANTWEKGPVMNIARGYQGNTTLSDGSLFTIGGSWSSSQKDNFPGKKNGELYADNKWIELPGITAENTVMKGTFSTVADKDGKKEGAYRTDNHAWMWEAPNGQILHAGPGTAMHWIDVKKGSVTDAGDRSNVADINYSKDYDQKEDADEYAMNGTAVMYDIGKIFKTGGATTYDLDNKALNKSFIIDINKDTPDVKKAANLTHSRTMVSGVVLPTGEVFVVGGLSRAKIFSDKNPTLIPELWNPNGNSIRDLAPMVTPRTYHSAAILLTDGRVLVGGGGLFDNISIDHENVEIYSPSYLFEPNGNLAIRPEINIAPKFAGNEKTIQVTASKGVSKFTLIRMGSVTHSVNNETRRVPLIFPPTFTNVYSLKIPNASVAIPGYYMLFALNKDGVPSISKVIRIGETKVKLPKSPRYEKQTANIPGTIEAEYYDNWDKKLGFGYYDIDGKAGDLNFRPTDNVDCNILSDPNYKVCWTNKNEWLKYSVIADTGTYNIVITATSEIIGSKRGNLEISLGDQNLGLAKITKTGNWLTPKDFTIYNVNITGGFMELKLKILSDTMFDIDKITFNKIDSNNKEKHFDHSHEAKSISIYPNPVSNVLYVLEAKSNTKLEVFNLIGQKMLEGFGTFIDVEKLSSGNYILKSDGNPSQQFIKQ